jgi:hypothetical protein
VAAHCAKLEGKRPSAPPKRVAELRTRALREGPASLSALEWKTLAECAESMQLLHREAWRRWPVEAWDLGREEPQLPPETARPVLAASSSPSQAAASQTPRSPASHSHASHSHASVATLSSDRARPDSVDRDTAVDAGRSSNDTIAATSRPATLHPASRRIR